MNRSSFIDAFRVLGRKPFLLLLLLPVQAATLLITKYLPEMSVSAGTYDTDMTGLLIILLLYAVILLINLLSSFFLLPPAMELLQDGAARLETPCGWYGRGLKKHWWKPVTIGAMELSIEMVLYFIFYCIFYCIIVLVMLFLAIFALASATAAPQEPLTSMDMMGYLFLLLLLVLVIPFVLLLIFISGISSFLLPALADRNFGAAFKLAFSKRGMKKILKLTGAQMLLGLAGGAIYVALAAGYVLLSDGIPSSFDSAMSALGSFSSSWTGFFTMLLISFTSLYQYAYSFCLLQEVRNEEDTDILKIACRIP